MKRITAQQAHEAQELLDIHKLGVTDHYPPTLKQIAEAERTIRQYANPARRFLDRVQARLEAEYKRAREAHDNIRAGAIGDAISIIEVVWMACE